MNQALRVFVGGRLDDAFDLRLDLALELNSSRTCRRRWDGVEAMELRLDEAGLPAKQSPRYLRRGSSAVVNIAITSAHALLNHLHEQCLVCLIGVSLCAQRILRGAVSRSRRWRRGERQ